MQENKPKILDWINYNNKAYGNDPKPITSAERKVADAVEAERFNDKILKRDKYAPMKEASPQQMRTLEDKILKQRYMEGKNKYGETPKPKTQMELKREAHQKKIKEIKEKKGKRNYWEYFRRTGRILEPTPEELKRASGPSDWELIYDSMTPMEKGQWNAEKRKQGMDGRTGDPLPKEKPKPVKYPEVVLSPLPVIDPHQKAREEYLERKRLEAITPRPDPDQFAGLGSLRHEVRKELGRASWEKNNRRKYI